MGKFDCIVKIDDSCGRYNSEGKKIYTNHDIVRGTVTLKFKKNTNIKTIDVSLMGMMLTTFRQYVFDGSSTIVIYHEEPHTFFIQPLNLFPNIKELSSSGPYTFLEGSTHEYPFELLFPMTSKCNRCHTVSALPPTFPKMQDDRSSSEINYNVVVTVNYISSITSTLKGSKFMEELEFKPRNIPNLNYPDVLESTTTSNFKNKIKKYLDSANEPNQIIENPITNTHRHTRLIRKIFNDNYRDEKFKQLTANVPLSVTLESKQIIMNKGEIVDDLSIKLGCQIDDLKPDYILKNNESSKLGEFMIKDLKIKLNTMTSTECKGLKSLKMSTDVLYESKSSPLKEFDIGLFTSKEGDSFIKRIAIQQLINNDSKSDTNELQIPDTSKFVSSFIQCNAIKRSYKMGVELYISPNTQTNMDPSEDYVYRFLYNLQIGKPDPDIKYNVNMDIEEDGKVPAPAYVDEFTRHLDPPPEFHEVIKKA